MPEIIDKDRVQALKERAISQPLLEHIYIADPSAHVFDGRIYICLLYTSPSPRD